MRRCPACGLLFVPDRSAESLRALYASGYLENYPLAENYLDDAQRAYEARRRIALVRRHAAGGRLLEIGAATGHFLAAARAAGFEPVGIEPDAAQARQASERTGVPVHAGYLETVPLPPVSFDVVCAWHVVEHLAEPGAALGRVREWLRPGGRLILEVPNVGSELARRHGARWSSLDLRHHVGHFTPEAMQALLTRAGLAVERLETVSMRVYIRPGPALRPRELAAALREVALVRTPRRRHPSRHELLRAVARLPG